MSYSKLYDTLLRWGSQEVKQEGGWTKCYCPLHEDSSPSARVDVKTGVFQCFKCNDGAPISPESFYSLIMDVPIAEAGIIISEYRRFNGILVKNDESVDAWVPSNRFSDIIGGYSLGKYVKEYADKRGLSIETCEQYGLVDDNEGNVVIPYYWCGKVCGLKYRGQDSSKFAEAGSFFGLLGMDQLHDPINEGKPVIICEGESDTLRMASLVGNRAVVVGTSGIRFKSEWIREFDQVDDVLFIPQSDEASKGLVSSLSKAFNGRIKVQRLEWKRGQIGKDVCDWLVWNDGDRFASRCLSHFSINNTPRRPISGRELERYITEDEGSLIEDLLNRREAMLIVGDPKARKTFCALNMIRVLTLGGNLFGVDRFACPGGFKVGLVEEEGNYAKLINSRFMPIFMGADDSWRDRFWLTYKLGVKMTDERWMNFLSDWIDDKGLDVLFLDPLQNLHDSDENDASEMGHFWGAISRLLVRHPKLSIVVLHHFSKAGGEEVGWASIRGSSRHGAAVDLAFFMENTGYMKGKVTIKGRNIDHDDVKFELTMDSGIMKANDGSALLKNFETMVREAGSKGIPKGKVMADLEITEKILTQLIRKSDRVTRVTRSDLLIWSK